MGRIAEALKRAQHERAEVVVGTGSHGFAESDARMRHGVRISSSGTTSITDAPMLIPRRSPKPFPVNADPIPPESVDPQVLAFHDPGGQIAEKYRSARTRLLSANPGATARAYAITSALFGEGKTVTTANMGFSLAELRHLRVAMIDLDFRKCGLTRLFQTQDKPGIAEVLRSEKPLADACIPVVKDNLHLFPAGNVDSANPSDILASETMDNLFREINERFHYCLIDTPPIHAYADIGLIAPLCHSVLMVVRMNATPQPLLQRCVKMLEANHLTIAGCILTGYCEDAMSLNTSQDFFTNG